MRSSEKAIVGGRSSGRRMTATAGTRGEDALIERTDRMPSLLRRRPPALAVDVPIDIKFELRDEAGASVRPAQSVGDERVALTLPRLPAVDPSARFHWLYEVFEGDEFLGYTWSPDEADDLDADTVTFTVPVGGLQGTVFLPASITPGWVQNHDPMVHTWSGPTQEARDFGVAGPQWTTFTVVAPQVGTRLFVHSPVVQNYAWIEVMGVGPSGPPE